MIRLPRAERATSTPSWTVGEQGFRLGSSPCIEERCGVDDLGWIGDAFCNSVEDPEYDTAQCAFDGGDC